jgi:hypothetical protein
MRCTIWPGWRISLLRLLLLLAITSSQSAATAGLVPIDGSSSLTSVVQIAGFPVPPNGATLTADMTNNPALTFPSGLLGATVTSSLAQDKGGGHIDQSVATISAGRFADPGTASVGFGPGTGVTQFVPSGQTHNQAQLKIQFTALWQNQGASPITAPMTGGYNIPLIMDVALGGNVELQVSMTITVYDSSMKPIGSQTISPLVPYTNSTATNGTPFTTTLTDSEPLTIPTIDINGYVGISGTIEFDATNDAPGSDISIPSDSVAELFAPEGPSQVPEPGSLALLGVMSGMWLGRAWHRRKQRAAEVAA